MSLRNIIKPYPSPIITGRGIDLDFPMLAGCLALLGLESSFNFGDALRHLRRLDTTLINSAFTATVRSSGRCSLVRFSCSGKAKNCRA